MAASGGRPLHDRRQGPLAEVKRRSDIYLLRDLDGIVDFDAKVAHGALDLGVPEQELHCAQVSRPAIDQHRFRAPQRVGAELGWVEPDAGNPLMNKTRVNLRKSA